MQLRDAAYVVLEPTFSRYVDADGNRKATGFKAVRLTRGKPSTKQGETAVRLNLTVDSSVFEAMIPVVNVELGEREMFVNTAVEVTATSNEEED